MPRFIGGSHHDSIIRVPKDQFDEYLPYLQMPETRITHPTRLNDPFMEVKYEVYIRTQITAENGQRMFFYRLENMNTNDAIRLLTGS